MLDVYRIKVLLLANTVLRCSDLNCGQISEAQVCDREVHKEEKEILYNLYLCYSDIGSRLC